MIKKAITYFLIILVIIFMVVTLLGVWGIIDLDNILRKLLISLLVIFVSSAVVMFIFSVLTRDDDRRNEGK